MQQDDNRPRDPDAPDEGRDDLEDLEIELLPREAEETQEAEAEPELPPAPSDPAPADPDTIVIDSDDLLDVDDTPLPEAGPDLLPPVDELPAAEPGFGKKGKAGLLSGGLVGSMLLQMALAGGIGGLVAWMLTEPGARADELSPFPGARGLQLLVEMAVFGGILGGLIGLALGAAEGVVTAAWSRAATGGALGLLIGGAGGAVGGVVGQLAFASILDRVGDGAGLIHAMPARCIGWALVGAFVGLGPGVMMMAPRKMLNGLLGGLAGGFIAGLLFDPIGAALYLATGATTATASRLVGIIALGVCTGCGVGLVEEIRKQAWIVIVSGPLTGKQFIIYKPVTFIGSAPGMDIPLVKDRAIAPKHCALEEAGGGHVVRDVGPGQTLVNSRPVTAQRLGDGDVVHIGQTGLQYRTRPLAAGPTG